MVTTYPPITPSSIEQVSAPWSPFARRDEEQQTLVDLPSFFSRKEAKEKEEKRQARLAFLKVPLQVRIPWVISPWLVKDIGQYSLQELVIAALEHCCKLHQGEVAREVYLPFLFPGKRATLIFHQMKVHVRCDRVLPTNVVICVR